MPKGKFHVVGYKTKEIKKFGSIEAKTTREAAEKLKLKPYLAFTYLPAQDYEECLESLEKGITIFGYLVETA